MGQALGVPVGQSNLGVKLLKKGFAHEAIPYLERSHVEDPQEWEHLSNLGVAHRLEGEFVQAKECLQQALRLSPDSPEIWLNFGVLMDDMGDFEDALEAFRVAYEWIPENQTAAFNYASSLLRFGRWHEAWPLWELGRHDRTHVLPKSIKRWEGQSLSGKRILVVREGGLGDTFLYMRWLKDLVEMDAHVTLMVWHGQKELLRGHPWIHEVVEGYDDKYDFCVPIMSLPALLDADLSVPAMIGYLQSSGSVLGTQNFKRVGICWKAKEMGTHRRIRSLADEDLYPLSGVGVEWFSLQKDICLPWMTNVNGFMQDWKTTAAVIQDLDLVVSCDTAVANLAGAMGKETWVMLPRNAEWKWGIGTEESKLYPTARLFRASTLWTEVTEKVASELS